MVYCVCIDLISWIYVYCLVNLSYFFWFKATDFQIRIFSLSVFSAHSNHLNTVGAVERLDLGENREILRGPLLTKKISFLTGFDILRQVYIVQCTYYIYIISSPNRTRINGKTVTCRPPPPPTLFALGQPASDINNH